MMKQASDEKGYALIIVLFAIVFITILTAVFMKGSLNSRVQEKTVDENNLVVVAAEAGLDYYRWQLDDVYDGLIKDFNANIEGWKNAGIPLEQMNDKRNEFVDELIGKFKDEINKYTDANISIVSNHYHKLLASPQPEVIKKPAGPARIDEGISIHVTGTVEGTGDGKPKELDFKMLYKIPIIESNETTDDSIEIAEIGLQKEPCPTGQTVVGGNCNKSNSNESGYNFEKSNIYVDGQLDSWGGLEYLIRISQ